MTAAAALDATQLAFMNEEFCILVDECDGAVGHASKRECHLNSNIFVDANALLHRAFSVLLFNERNELLLQRRADDKITFGGYWTNTCCSHPLHGREPDESDGVDGVRLDVVRKLEHELGIPRSDTLLRALQPVTRVRYSARSNDVWGENEIDYILLVRVDGGKLALAPNANEVSDTQFVSRELMRVMMSDGTVLTPWFRLLSEHFLFEWWQRMEEQTAKLEIEMKWDNEIHHFK